MAKENLFSLINHVGEMRAFVYTRLEVAYPFSDKDLEQAIKTLPDEKLREMVVDKGGYFRKKMNTFDQYVLKDEKQRLLSQEYQTRIQEEKLLNAVIKKYFDFANREYAARKNNIGSARNTYYTRQDAPIKEVKKFDSCASNSYRSRQDDEIEAARRDVVELMAQSEEIENFARFVAQGLKNDSALQQSITKFEKMIQKQEAALEVKKRYIESLKKQGETVSGSWNWLISKITEEIESQKRKLFAIHEQIRLFEHAQLEQNIGADITRLKASAANLHADWLRGDKKFRISQFKKDRSILEWRISKGKESLQNCQDELGKLGKVYQEKYRQDICSIELLYQDAEKLYKQLVKEYEFFTNQTAICGQYEKEFLPQLAVLAGRLLRKYAYQELSFEYQKIRQETSKYEIVLADIDNTKFSSDMEILRKRQLQIIEMLKFRIDQFEKREKSGNSNNTSPAHDKASAAQDVTDEAHAPEYDSANNFASTQMIMFSPILKEPVDTRIQYFLYLKKLLHLAEWDRKKYTKAQIAFYEKKLCAGKKVDKFNQKVSFGFKYCYLLPYDLAAMLGFQSELIKPKKIKKIINQIIFDFGLPNKHANFLYLEFEAALGNPMAWNEVLESNLLKEFRQYLKQVKQNSDFINTKPYNVLITATMSAGKSTLVNALVGKDISRMQNMACTSKIHRIISKPFEDDATSKYDYEISMDASKDELLNNHAENKSDQIAMGTYFHGALSGKRVVLLDSPGVNSSENSDHAKISQAAIRSRKYRLMLYILNATQLGTTDEEYHLEVVREQMDYVKIIFIMNKADQLISEDDNVMNAIESQRKFLISKGFQNPVICPVSARAAYLVKKSQTESLSRLERREMENYMDKFVCQSLSPYYKQHFGCLSTDTEDESEALFRNCGFAYLEEIIANILNGGKKYGSNLC